MNDIRTSIEIAASPHEVWAAPTDPGRLASWWGSDEDDRTHDWQIELRPGGQWSCRARNASGDLSGVSGTLLEIDPPRTLAYTWNPSWQAIPETAALGRSSKSITLASQIRTRSASTNKAGAVSSSGCLRKEQDNESPFVTRRCRNEPWRRRTPFDRRNGCRRP